MNEDRNWMYTGRKTTDSITSEWIDKTTEFLDMAFSRNTGHYGVMCPCNQCFNRRPQIRSIMIKHLYKFGFRPAPFEDCWLQVIRQKWCKEEWLQISESCRQRRSLMPGPSHHQGTASLTRFKDQMEEKEKRPVSDVSAYISSRKGRESDSLCHDRAKRVVEKYAEVAKEKFGQDFDIMNEPLDPSCAYKAGCGKKHGRLLIGNGYVDSQETVSNSRTMSGATTDEMRPTRRMRTSVDRIAEVEAQLKQLQQQILYLTQNQNPQVEEAQGSGQLGITGTADSVGNNIAVNLETSQEQVDECNNVVPT